MGFLDEMENKKDKQLRENPLANVDIKKERLQDSTIRIDGDTHTKILALRHVFVDMSNKDVFNMAIQQLVDNIDDKDKEAFEKYYSMELEQKIDILKKKGMY